MRLVIIGAGGHGQSVREIAIELNKYSIKEGRENIIFLDDRYNDVQSETLVYGTVSYNIKDVCENFKNYINDDTEFYPAFGDNKCRLEWEEKISRSGGKLATIIHPTAYIAKSVLIEPGTVIFPNVIINTGCIIKKACIINLGAIIDHGCVINDACHINAGAIIMAENHVPRYTKVNSGEVIALRKWIV